MENLGSQEQQQQKNNHLVFRGIQKANHAMQLSFIFLVMDNQTIHHGYLHTRKAML